MSDDEIQEIGNGGDRLHIPGLDWESPAELSASAYRQADVRFEDRLSVLPKHGFCLWPEDGEDWIHPGDLEVARTLIPSKRIFRKEDCSDEILGRMGYVEYSYGDVAFRGLPTLWHEVASEGYEIGDTVELKSGYGKLRPIIADIAGMFWNRHEQVIEYALIKNGVPQPNRYQSSQFRLCMKIGVAPTPRQKALLNRENSLNGL
ncbi:hypothetical protein [Mariniblastus fucicola]|uniref:Uncharacterized protein n=1 Tax=Mariniblastus fucicola TaxID=980251 RepID=A0A5B9PA92_9BACT|nr:hypothetical protein [Mariniblastus fucicola]QEG21850.1 hypothetical protein MFFC18_17110 [Mariniblastus fucicola]